MSSAIEGENSNRRSNSESNNYSGCQSQEEGINPAIKGKIIIRNKLIQEVRPTKARKIRKSTLSNMKLSNRAMKAR